MNNAEKIKFVFSKWRNMVEKWRLSFKLTILRKKDELETEKVKENSIFISRNI
jgi:hypothetical protein